MAEQAANSISTAAPMTPPWPSPGPAAVRHCILYMPHRDISYGFSHLGEPREGGGGWGLCHPGGWCCMCSTCRFHPAICCCTAALALAGRPRCGEAGAHSSSTFTCRMALALHAQVLPCALMKPATPLPVQLSAHLAFWVLPRNPTCAAQAADAAASSFRVVHTIVPTPRRRNEPCQCYPPLQRLKRGNSWP